MKLSILDQSPITQGSNAREALQQTLQVAQLADELGYTRLWLSEHHDAPTLAGSTPEVLIANLAAHTKRIRLGSGGVMLPHYSAYKVAENFRMLEALYPGRIDVGIGRAPGGMPRSTMALQEGKLHKANYAQQVEDLLYYLTDTLPEDHRFPGLTAAPVTDTVPELWLLGSSGGSASVASALGTAFTFAHFINAEGGAEVVETYRSAFQPSVRYTEPEVSVAVFVFCADTDDEADKMASSLDLSLVRLANGQRQEGTPTVETALAYQYNKYEQALVRENRKRMIVGSPTTVKREIEALAAAYGADEVMIATNAADFKQRIHSYQLVAEAFNLEKN